VQSLEEPDVFQVLEEQVVAYANVTGELNEITLTENGDDTFVDVKSSATGEVLATYTASGYAIDSLIVGDVGYTTDDDLIFSMSSYAGDQGAVIVVYGPDLVSSTLAPDGIAGDFTAISGGEDAGISAGLGRLVAVGLVDDDEINDVVMTGFDNAYVLLGSAAPLISMTMQDLDQTIVDVFAPDEIWISDMNGDALGDLIYLNNEDIYMKIAPFDEGYINHSLVLEDEEAMKSLIKSAGDTSGSLALASGDFNDDGIEDIAVGLGLADEVQIFFGSSEIDAASILAVPDVTIYGLDAGDMLGARLASADVDGDGIADLVISASGDDGEDNKSEDCGGFYVLYGSAYLEGDLIASSLFAIYNDVAGEDGGATLFTYDINGDGISAVSYTHLTLPTTPYV
jgi:hypothetical protein